MKDIERLKAEQMIDYMNSEECILTISSSGRVCRNVTLMQHPFTERPAPSAVVVIGSRCHVPLNIHPVQELEEVKVFNGGDAVHGGEALKHLKSFGVVVTSALLNHSCQVLPIMGCDNAQFHVFWRKDTRKK